MTDRIDMNSNFSGPVGIGMLGIGAVIACYFRIYTLGGTLFFLALIFLFSWLWGRYALTHLDIRMRQSEWTGFPGEKIKLGCRVKNDKLLPLLWLELGFPLPDNGCIEAAVRRKVASVRWYEELEFSLQGKAKKRGIIQYDSITAASGDGFGLGEKSREILLQVPVTITVFPQVYEVDTGRLLHSFSDVQQGDKGYLEDVSLLKMNRAYEPQDSARKINWRQLAVGGRLTTNIYETMLPRIVTFILDIGAFRMEAEEENDSTKKCWIARADELEAMLSFVASCVVELKRNHASCRIAVPGEQLQYSSDRSEEGLLSQLAAVEYSGEVRLFSTEDAAELEERSGIKLLISRDWQSFTGKNVFSGGSRNMIFMAMQQSTSEEDCPWRQMYAEEFVCSSGENG